MKNALLLFRYLPLFFLAGAVILYLDEGVGFARAIDVGLGSLFTSTTGVSLLIACIFSWIYYFYDRRKQKSSPQPVPQQQAASAEPDIKFYEQALAELDSGERDSGIWAKAYAEAADEEGSRKLYVKLRATSLMNEQARSLIDVAAAAKARSLIDEAAAAEEIKLGVVGESQKLKRQKDGEEDIFFAVVLGFFIIAILISVTIFFS